MYGQNLGGRPDVPGEPIFTKFCVLVHVPDVFLCFEFQKDRVKMWELCMHGVEISPLPLTRHIAYTIACCYCTSRDRPETLLRARQVKNPRFAVEILMDGIVILSEI